MESMTIPISFKKLLTHSFDKHQERLPTVQQFRDTIALDRMSIEELVSFEKTTDTFAFRCKYVKESFPILTDEFLVNISKVVNSLEIKNIADLCCGMGWLSFWMKKYGIEVKSAIDNKTWHHHSGMKYLAHVTKGDAAEFVKDHPEIELFILSWPNYNESQAANIWKAMKKGQYLLYIGEGQGGCTANDEFFNLIEDKELTDYSRILQSNFISFWGIRDWPFLFQK